MAYAEYDKNGNACLRGYAVSASNTKEKPLTQEEINKFKKRDLEEMLECLRLKEQEILKELQALG